MFALYIVKTSNDFYGLQQSVKHEVASRHIKVQLSHQITIK